jgi:hypothetical protein
MFLHPAGCEIGGNMVKPPAKDTDVRIMTQQRNGICKQNMINKIEKISEFLYHCF